MRGKPVKGVAGVAERRGVKALVASVCVFALGMVGFVVQHQSGKQAPAATDHEAAAEVPDVAILSTGQKVDIQARVPRQGLTIVEFTADF